VFAQLDPSLDTSKSTPFSLFNPSCRLHCFCNPHSFPSNSDSNTRSKSDLRFAVGRLKPLRIDCRLWGVGRENDKPILSAPWCLARSKRPLGSTLGFTIPASEPRSEPPHYHPLTLDSLAFAPDKMQWRGFAWGRPEVPYLPSYDAENYRSNGLYYAMLPNRSRLCHPFFETKIRRLEPRR
jgi:hypothetical protein